MSSYPRNSETTESTVPVDHGSIVRQNISWMLALAERIIGERQLAEDAVQDAFVNMFCGLKNFSGRANFKTWLHRIVVNAALAKLRKLDRLKEEDIAEWLPEFDQNECRLESPWSQLAKPEDILASERLRQEVIKQIQSLPDSYRVILQLRDIEEIGISEVASLCEISEANVKVRLHRARAALKKKLEPILRGELSP